MELKIHKNINRFNFQTDSTTTITLTDYEPNHLTYISKNENAGIAVFSEMYYEHGWNAYIDGKPQDHFKVNYVLRAMKVPAGEHKIEFKFEPQVVETGSKITLASSILLGLILLGGIGFSFWRSKKEEKATVELIKIVSDLWLDKQIELVLFRKPLRDKKMSEILSVFDYARDFVNKPIEELP